MNDLLVGHTFPPLRPTNVVGQTLYMRPKSIRTGVTQRGVYPVTMIKHFPIVNDRGFGSFRGLFLGRGIEPFVSHTSEHAFHRRIVPIIATPIHAADHLMPVAVDQC